MSLVKACISWSTVLLVSSSMLVPQHAMADSEYHIYGGDFCQANVSSMGGVDHVEGTIYFSPDPVTGVTPGGWVDCPVPRTFKQLTPSNQVTVKVAVHDSGNNEGMVGVQCILESYSKYSTNNWIDSDNQNTVAPGGTAVETDATLTLSVKPVDANGHYRLLCYLPAKTATSLESSSISSYEIKETD